MDDDVVRSGAPTPMWTPQELPPELDRPASATPPAPSLDFSPPSQATPAHQFPAAPVAVAYRHPPGYQPAYPGAPSYYGPPVQPPTNTLPIVGFVLSIVLPLIGLIVSIVALVRIRRSGGAGKGFAIAGVAIPGVWIVLAIAIPIFMDARLQSEEGPREAMTELADAMAAGDCDGFQAHTTLEFRQMLGMAECAEFDAWVTQVNAHGGFRDLPIVDVSVDGDVATVTILERNGWDVGAEVVRVEYRIVRVYGSWLVDNLALPD